MTVLSLSRWRGVSAGRPKAPRPRASMGQRNASAAAEGESVARLPFTMRTAIHVVLGVILLICLTILMKSAVAWLTRDETFQIKRSVVSGDLQQIDRLLVEKRAHNIRGNFFTIDLASAANDLKTIPWVRSVRLRRLWPDGIEIQLEEHRPVAYWGDDDQLLNQQGEVFEADYLADLPHFEGPPESGPEMVQTWERFGRLLAPLGCQIDSLKLSSRQAWTVHLDNGLTLVLGRDDADARLERFALAYGELKRVGALSQGTVVDLRYADGLAVRPAV